MNPQDQEKRVRRDWPDLDYSVIADPIPGDADPAKVFRAQFLVYQHMGLWEDGALVFQKSGSDSYVDPVRSIEDAEIWMTGVIRWDGESAWNTECLQFYSRADFADLAEMMARCWDLAGELMPETWAPNM